MSGISGKSDQVQRRLFSPTKPCCGLEVSKQWIEGGGHYLRSYLFSWEKLQTSVGMCKWLRSTVRFHLCLRVSCTSIARVCNIVYVVWLGHWKLFCLFFCLFVFCYPFCGTGVDTNLLELVQSVAGCFISLTVLVELELTWSCWSWHEAVGADVKLLELTWSCWSWHEAVGADMKLLELTWSCWSWVSQLLAASPHCFGAVGRPSTAFLHCFTWPLHILLHVREKE